MMYARYRQTLKWLPAIAYLQDTKVLDNAPQGARYHQRTAPETNRACVYHMHS